MPTDRPQFKPIVCFSPHKEKKRKIKKGRKKKNKKGKKNSVA
jgi:hypothetical protein